MPSVDASQASSRWPAISSTTSKRSPTTAPSCPRGVVRGWHVRTESVHDLASTTGAFLGDPAAHQQEEGDADDDGRVGEVEGGPERQVEEVHHLPPEHFGPPQEAVDQVAEAPADDHPDGDG